MYLMAYRQVGLVYTTISIAQGRNGLREENLPRKSSSSFPAQMLQIESQLWDLGKMQEFVCILTFGFMLINLESASTAGTILLTI